MSGHEADALRAMVREVLREVLPPGGEPARGSTDAGVRQVRVRDDRDLAAVVTQVLDLADDPDRLADLRSGRLRFALVTDSDDAADDPPASASTSASPLEVERGAVTERLVHRAAREQRPLRIGPRAVVTPLARDRARALGVSIERTTVSSEEGRDSR
jgi:hypothetical protein